jgi:AraC-like DNA-binding protein
MPTPAPIRIARLPAPFVYMPMEAIEAERQHKAGDDLPHRHDFYTIVAVETATGGTHQIDFKDYPLTPNTVYFVSPEQVHHVLTQAGAPPTGHVLLFSADFLLRHSMPPEQLLGLELFFNCDEARPLVLEAQEMADLRMFFQKLAHETAADRPDRLEVLGAWLKLLLLELKRLKADKALDNLKWDHRQAAIVRRFKSDVEQHFARWHQVADYAQAQNLSSSYLNEVVKSETGSSAKDLIQNRLVLEAKRLARYANLSAKEIAYQLGYEDVAHFSKFFKKCTGRTFSAFKEQA